MDAWDRGDLLERLSKLMLQIKTVAACDELILGNAPFVANLLAQARKAAWERSGSDCQPRAR